MTEFVLDAVDHDLALQAVDHDADRTVLVPDQVVGAGERREGAGRPLPSPGGRPCRPSRRPSGPRRSEPGGPCGTGDLRLVNLLGRMAGAKDNATPAVAAASTAPARTSLLLIMGDSSSAMAGGTRVQAGSATTVGSAARCALIPVNRSGRDAGSGSGRRVEDGEQPFAVRHLQRPSVDDDGAGVGEVAQDARQRLGFIDRREASSWRDSSS